MNFYYDGLLNNATFQFPTIQSISPKLLYKLQGIFGNLKFSVLTMEVFYPINQKSTAGNI